ncbi:MAG TPA: tetratricopeptide repeat protein [Pyrinomonadaceae bacterium]|nr:tetratricopeptide repeat protein [Pyrinomonadaceae bacterium]
MNIPLKLQKQLRANKVIPFVGAGVSMSVKGRETGDNLFPSWKELLMRAAERLESEQKADYAAIVRSLLRVDEVDYLYAAGQARKNLGAVWYELLKEELDPPRNHADDKSLDLARSVWEIGSRLIVTTNYDRVLKWACPQQDDLTTWDIESPVEQAEIFREGTRRPTVWHLHGQIGNAANLILTRDGYNLLYPEAKQEAVKPKYEAALTALRFLLASHTFLFIGFSFDDAYFGMQLNGINKIFKGATGPHYILARKADQDRVRAIDLPVEMITFDKFDDLPNLVRELGGIAQTGEESNEELVDRKEDIFVTTHAADYGPHHSVFFVPYRQKGAQVIGREDALQAVRKQLTEGYKTSIGQTAAFQGLGGLGKTQLAVEYAYRYADEYPNGVIWLTADQDIDAQLIELSEKARWVAPKSEHKYKLEIAQKRLRSYSDCLIIFDNLEDRRKIDDYLPEPQANPHILVTSRIEQPDFFPISINLLDETLSQKLLIQEAQRKIEGDAEMAATLEIARALQGLPLALELAGAYLRHRQEVRFQQYRDFLNQNLREALPGNLSSFTKHEADLYHTLKINEEILKENNKLRNILDLLTWSGSAPMGKPLMCALLGIQNPLELTNALGLGTALRLLQRSPDAESYAIHRLVSKVRREEIPLAESLNWIDSICEQMGDWFQNQREDFTALPAFEAEIDHLKAWQDHAITFAPEHASRLTWLQAYPPYHRGQYQESKIWVEKALHLFGEIQKNDLALKAHLLNDLGYCYGALGHHMLSLEYTEKALVIRLELYGEQHPETAHSFASLGGVYNNLGDYNRALEFKEKALALRLKLYGEERPETAGSLASLGGVYNNLGDYNRALEYAERALALRLKLYGEQHPETAHSFDSLGGVYNRLGDYKSALEYVEKALAVRLELHGEQHPETADSFDSLGSVYNRLGDYKSALEYAERALALRLKLLGEQHPATASSFDNIGSLYNNLGNRKLELEYKEKALALYKKLLGDQHPTTLKLADYLARVFCKLGRPLQAFNMLDDFLRKLPPDHPQYSWLEQRHLFVRNLCPGLRKSSSGSRKQQKKRKKKGR